MKGLSILYLGALLSLVSGCQNRHKSATSISILDRTEVTVPTKESGASNLFVNGSGDAWLTWTEYIDDSTDALMLANFGNNQWLDPREVARGSDWFVNWADFPSVVTFNGLPATIAAHWLQKSATGTYDYDIHIAISKNNGTSWSESFILHSDGVAAEHGFVTLLPLDNGRVFATWLDGRNTREGGADANHGHGHQEGHSGAMTLRAAEFDAEGNLYNEAELDKRVCDCCQTDAVVTASGPVVVYRDRSESEERDISIVRFTEGQWSAPVTVHDDHWEIAGCPVNGPAIAANEDTVAVAWFTAANGDAAVNVSFSYNGGKSFRPPVRIDNGDPLGRVDIVLEDDGIALVSWLEHVGDRAEIRLVRVTHDGEMGESLAAGECEASRQSGFPVLVSTGESYLLTWTDVNDKTSVVSSVLQLD